MSKLTIEEAIKVSSDLYEYGVMSNMIVMALVADGFTLEKASKILEWAIRLNENISCNFEMS